MDSVATDDLVIEPGQYIGHKFRVESLLGTGAMGQVYLARQDLIGRPVAVKILKAGMAVDMAKVDQFHREAVAASRIRHPNVALIYDYGAYDNSLYIAMEYVEGDSLAQALDRHGSLDVMDAIEIAVQVTSAIEAAHAEGVLHRDIKPHNVLLGVGPAGLVVKVVDFGVAKLLDRAISMHTAAGVIMGTPEYMSPEHASGRRGSPAMDLYSLGVVLYEMLQGDPPFMARARMDVLAAHLRSPVPPMGPHVPPDLVRLVMHLLAKKPEDRPESATAVLGALRRAKRLLEIRELKLAEQEAMTTAANWRADADTVVEDSAAKIETAPMTRRREPRFARKVRPYGSPADQTQAIPASPRESAPSLPRPPSIDDMPTVEQAPRSGALRLLSALFLAVSVGVLLVVMGIWLTQVLIAR